MISVNEAKYIIEDNGTELLPVMMPLQQAAGLVLARTVYAIADIPPFNQSSMDGYAFCFREWEKKQSLTIKGEVAAGLTTSVFPNAYEAVRIFTGAAVPSYMDTVVMQEKVITDNNQLIIEDKSIKEGCNVRVKGSDIKAGSNALAEGSKLNPASIGFLASMGITEVCVYPYPKIKIVITGNELIQPGGILQHGQVYESNSFALKAVLQQMHLTDVSVLYVKDDPDELKQVLENALENCDILLITGGVSVGEYDFVAKALANCGVTTLLHTIKQKPGKPLFVGKRKKQLIFGLPGNPSSVLTCFYEYTIPAIERMMQLTTSCIQKKILPLTVAINKKIGFTHFLKAWATFDKVTPLGAQESYRLSSFATANCLICLEEDKTEYLAGDLVEVHLFP